MSRSRPLIPSLAALTAATALPLLLWHRPIQLVASDFRLELGYLVTGWSGFAMIALGLLLMLPVALSRGMRPESRLYPRGRDAYLGWGVSLYLLGALLSSQVATAVAAVH